MAAALTSDVERLTGHPPIDFADFALAYREVWERPRVPLEWSAVLR